MGQGLVGVVGMGWVPALFLEYSNALLQGIPLVCQAGLLLGIAVVTPDAVGDFGEVPDPGRGDDVNFLGELMVIYPRLTFHLESTTGFKQVHQSGK